MPAAPTMPLACRRGFALSQRQLVKGFTLVELVVVMVLVGIMASVAMVRYFGTKTFDAVAYTDRVAGMIRYGQKLAIAQNRAVYVMVDGAKVALCFDSGCTASNKVDSPGGNSGSSTTIAQCGSQTWECEAPPNSLTYSVSPTLSPTYFYFDRIGKPFLGSVAFGTASDSFNQLTLRVTGDGANHDIVIEQETGYVH
jgi:MSHA pilin protein MshC